MKNLSLIERDAVEHVHAIDMLSLVQRWVGINSGTRNLAGVAMMGSELTNIFSALPGTLTMIPPAPVDSVTAEGIVQPLVHGDHIRLTVRPDAPLQMLLTGHMDTVFGSDHPFQTARWRDDGALNAPGAADMKGGLALMFAALAAVEASPVASRLGYEVVINSDEETGSLSSAALIVDAARGKAAALTYEPALPDGTLAGARGGTGNFSITIHGRAAHAGRNPEDGRNAVVAAADLALRLADAKAPGLAVNPARIDGGGPNNMVPDLAVLRVNFRPATADDIAKARAAIATAVAAVTARHGVHIHVHGDFNRPPKPIDAGAGRLFALVKEVGADLGLDLAWRATGGVCDGNNIAACGIPVVDTMGARGGDIHSSNEFLLPDSLAERAALSAITILRMAERGGL